METYAEPKPFVDNPDFYLQKRENIEGLTDGMIDPPILDIVKALNSLPFCFTLQCCFGHFDRNRRVRPCRSIICPSAAHHSQAN